jgi:signal transduction histidine kinase
MGIKRTSGTGRWEEMLVKEWKRYAEARTEGASAVAEGACYLEPRPCPFEVRPDFETRFTKDCVHCARLQGAAERAQVATPGASGLLPTLALLIRLHEGEAGEGGPGDPRFRTAALLLRALPMLHASPHPERTARLLLALVATAFPDDFDALLYFEVTPEPPALALQASFRRADVDAATPVWDGFLDLDAWESAGAFDGAVYERLRESTISLDQDRDLLADAVFDGRATVVASPGRELRLPALLVEHLPDAPVAILPVFGHEHVRGLLVLSAAAGVAGWTADRMELLSAVTSQAGLALEGSTLNDVSRRRGAGLRALATAAGSALRAPRGGISTEATLQGMLLAVSGRAAIAWSRTDSGSFAIAGHHGDPVGSERLLSDIGEGLRHWFEADPKPILVPDVHLDPRFPGDLPESWGSALAVPLRSEETLHGAFLAIRPRGTEHAPVAPFDAEEALLAEMSAAIFTLGARRDAREEEARRADRRVQELEAQLRHQDKLAVVGERGIQVAQEIRNPIAAITGFARRMLRQAGPEDENRESLEIILRETERLERILTEQVSLAQMTKPRLKLQSLNALVQEVLELQSEELVRRRVRLLKRLAPDVPSLLLDSDKMRQVLQNVFQYALHQVPSGGRVRVETRHGVGHVQAEVAHDGPKVPGESLDRLFVPFSASRRYGAGVGLAVAYQIVREHGGEIRARSEGDWSSIVTIYLPVRENQDRRGKPDRRGTRSDRRRRLA